MPIKLIIFDFDGTLVDTMDEFANKAANLIQKYYGLEFKKARALYINTSGFPFKEQLNQIFPGNDLNKEVSNEFEKWKKTMLDSDKKLRESAKKVIESLKNKGNKVCISSNNHQENVDRIVNKLDLKVNAVLGYKENKFGKGEKHFSWLEKKFGIKKQEMIFIGDSLNDYKIASKNRVNFIALTSMFSEESFKKLDKKIPCFSNILDIEEWLTSNDFKPR